MYRTNQVGSRDNIYIYIYIVTCAVGDYQQAFVVRVTILNREL